MIIAHISVEKWKTLNNGIVSLKCWGNTGTAKIEFYT